MSLKERVNAIVAAQARVTQPDKDSSRTIARIPVKRGNIYVTHEKALEFGTCFACCRAISEDIAKLPWNVYARQANQRIHLDNSPLGRLLNVRPNPDMGSFTFRETLVMWALTWGNGYAEIERDISGRAKALWPLSPDRVLPRRAEDGRVVYEVWNPGGGKTYLEQADMFHLHGVGYDGLSGYSMVGLAAQSLGFGIAAEEHGASFYGNNTTPGLALKMDGTLSDEGFERIKSQITDRRGSARAYEGMILEQGLDFARPAMSQVDAQYVETRRQIIEEVCRWWRVPPHKVGELTRAHFSNIESQNIEYVTDSLLPWVKRLEEEADWKLVTAKSQASYTRIAIQALMRGDSAARAAYYKEMRLMGVMNGNEIRAFEDMDPMGPEGDAYLMQSQFTTLDKIINAPIAAPAPTPVEAAQKSAERLVNRVMQPIVNKARAAVTRYDRTEFAAWMDNQDIANENRIRKGIADIVPAVQVAYGSEVDIDIALDGLVTAARVELFGLHDGDEPDLEKVTAALIEAMK